MPMALVEATRMASCPTTTSMQTTILVCRKLLQGASPVPAQAASHVQISKPWDPSIKDPSNQPKLQQPENCVFKDVFGDLNDWKLLTLRQVEGKFVLGEVTEMFEDTLGEVEAAAARTLEKDCFFAYNAPVEQDESPDGYYYIVRATGEAFALTEDAVNVQ